MMDFRQYLHLTGVSPENLFRGIVLHSEDIRIPDSHKYYWLYNMHGLCLATTVYVYRHNYYAIINWIIKILIINERVRSEWTNEKKIVKDEKHFPKSGRKKRKQTIINNKNKLICGALMT